MSMKSENKSLELLINRFTETSEQVKELDTVVRNFGELATDLKTTLEIMEESFAAKEISQHSKDALAKLKEMKVLNEAQVLDKLEGIVNKELTKHLKTVQTKLDQTIQHSVDMQAEMKELLSASPRKEKAKQDYDWFESDHDNDDNLQMMKQIINRLNAKVKKIEDNYALRIILLENEVEMLKEKLGITDDKPENSPSSIYPGSRPINITEDDLPF